MGQVHGHLVQWTEQLLHACSLGFTHYHKQEVVSSQTSDLIGVHLRFNVANQAVLTIHLLVLHPCSDTIGIIGAVCEAPGQSKVPNNILQILFQCKMQVRNGCVVSAKLDTMKYVVKRHAQCQHASNVLTLLT